MYSSYSPAAQNNEGNLCESSTTSTSSKVIDSRLLHDTLMQIEKKENNTILYQSILNHPCFHNEKAKEADALTEEEISEEIRKLLQMGLQDKNLHLLLILVKILVSLPKKVRILYIVLFAFMFFFNNYE
jgi:hypothetical protein